MSKWGKHSKEVVIYNIDYYDNPICFGALRITIDGQDSVVFTDTSGIVKIRLSQNTQIVRITTFTKPEGFYVPITNMVLPSEIKIVWGYIKDSPTILTICSKVPIKDKELTKISESLFLGTHIDSELYYYYFSDE